MEERGKDRKPSAKEMLEQVIDELEDDGQRPKLTPREMLAEAMERYLEAGMAATPDGLRAFADAAMAHSHLYR